jgi:hypothetical protein
MVIERLPACSAYCDRPFVFSVKTPTNLEKHIGVNLSCVIYKEDVRGNDFIPASQTAYGFNRSEIVDIILEQHWSD